jgi:diketogulonate reductase-like aldo/keto reductase
VVVSHLYSYSYYLNNQLTHCSYLNEDEVGWALKEWLSRNPTIKREDIFITTKVWPHLTEPEDVEWSLDNSLNMLGTNYVDSFLVHWPFACEKTEDNKVRLGPDGKVRLRRLPELEVTNDILQYIIKKALTENPEPIWRMMEKLHKSGKTRSIGVSNWTLAGLEALMKYAEIKPAINQVEIHPFLPNKELIAYCNANCILPVAYSPLGSQQQCPTTGEKVMENAALNAIAENKGVTLVQLLIAWGLKRGYAVLPKSSVEARIRSNFQIVDLSEEEFEGVNKVAEGRHSRFVNPKDMFGFDVWPDESS